jgi:uncharacterized surface protein with fasciclin (FAS1) repeats
MRNLRFVLAFALMALIAVVPALGQDMMTDEQTIAEIVVAATEGDAPEFTVLLAAVAAANPSFLEVLSDPEASVTVFAPTDAAFAALLDALGVTAEDVLADTALVDTILAYHVVPGKFDAEAVVAADGALLGTYLVNSALAVSVTDEGVFVNESQVITADIMASNGIIHIIDSVLVPEMGEGEMMAEMEEPTASIAEAVVGAANAEEPQFTVLLAAVMAADPSIAAMLSDGGPYTVFAPTDDAFAALLEALGVTAEELLAETDLLNVVLSYHVVPGKFDAATVVGAAGEEGFSIATLLPGGLLDVAVVDGGVVINGSVNVIATDIYATNGIIHVIDAVLVPEMEMETE